jgi:hypothetical protein
LFRRNEGEACDGLKDVSTAVFGFETVCKQKYASRRLLAVKKADDPNANANQLVTVMEYFRLPSCCVCHVRRRVDKTGGG